MVKSVVKRLELVEKIAKEEANINNLLKEQKELAAKPLVEGLEAIQRSGTEITKTIQNLKDAGKEVSDELYDAQLANYDE